MFIWNHFSSNFTQNQQDYPRKKEASPKYLPLEIQSIVWVELIQHEELLTEEQNRFRRIDEEMCMVI